MGSVIPVSCFLLTQVFICSWGEYHPLKYYTPGCYIWALEMAPGGVKFWEGCYVWGGFTFSPLRSHRRWLFKAFPQEDFDVEDEFQVWTRGSVVRICH